MLPFSVGKRQARHVWDSWFVLQLSRQSSHTMESLNEKHVFWHESAAPSSFAWHGGVVLFVVVGLGVLRLACCFGVGIQRPSLVWGGRRAHCSPSQQSLLL